MIHGDGEDVAINIPSHLLISSASCCQRAGFELSDDGRQPLLSDRKARVVHRDDLPEWLKPTPGIMRGYRVGYSKWG